MIDKFHQVIKPPRARNPEVYAPIVRYSYLPETQVPINQINRSINPINRSINQSIAPQLRTRSIFWNKVYAPPSYMDVAANLLSTAVGSKLRSIGYSLPFVWTTFDQVS